MRPMDTAGTVLDPQRPGPSVDTPSYTHPPSGNRKRSSSSHVHPIYTNKSGHGPGEERVGLTPGGGAPQQPGWTQILSRGRQGLLPQAASLWTPQAAHSQAEGRGEGRGPPSRGVPAPPSCVSSAKPPSLSEMLGAGRHRASSIGDLDTVAVTPGAGPCRAGVGSGHPYRLLSAPEGDGNRRTARATIQTTTRLYCSKCKPNTESKQGPREDRAQGRRGGRGAWRPRPSTTGKVGPAPRLGDRIAAPGLLGYTHSEPLQMTCPLWPVTEGLEGPPNFLTGQKRKLPQHTASPSPAARRPPSARPQRQG